MTWRDWITDGVVIALVYGLFRVVELYWGKRKQDKEIEKIDVETFVLVRGQVLEMEKKIVELRRIQDEQQARIEALEAELDNNREIIKQNKRTIEGLRNWGRKLLAWLQAQNLTGWPEPENGLLDTGEHKAVGK